MQLCKRRLILLAFSFFAGSLWGATPEKGTVAPDFELKTLAGESLKLSNSLSKGRTVLVVLRGYPGYQCPFCSRQVQDLIQHADAFAMAKTQVILVYPGPATDLNQHAEEFLKSKKLPGHFQLVVDPDYSFTNLYGLRWDAPKETAYPSTFLIDRDGKIFYEKISRGHGDRASAEELLQALDRAQ